MIDCSGVDWPGWLEGGGTIAAVVVALLAYPIGAILARHNLQRTEARGVGVWFQPKDGFYSVNGAALPVTNVEITCAQDWKLTMPSISPAHEARLSRVYTAGPQPTTDDAYERVVRFRFTDTDNTRWEREGARLRKVRPLSWYRPRSWFRSPRP